MIDIIERFSKIELFFNCIKNTSIIRMRIIYY